MNDLHTATAPAAHAAASSGGQAPSRTRAPRRAEHATAKAPSRPHRDATRKPDLSRPTSRSATPTVVLGGVPKEKRSVAAEQEKLAAPRMHTVRAEKRTPFPYGAIFAMILCTILFMYMVFQFVQINEYSLTLRHMQGELEELTLQQQSLALQLENRNDRGTISALAEDMGMVKMDQVEKIYLDGSGQDKIEITKKPTEPTVIDPISSLLSALFRNFEDLAEYID